MYSMHGRKLPKQFSLGSEAAADGVEQCLMHDSGLVALTAAQSLWTIDSWTDPRPQKLALIGGNKAPPHAMAVIPPAYTLSGCVEVSVSCFLCNTLCMPCSVSISGLTFPVP